MRNHEKIDSYLTPITIMYCESVQNGFYFSARRTRLQTNKLLGVRQKRGTKRFNSSVRDVCRSNYLKLAHIRQHIFSRSQRLLTFTWVSKCRGIIAVSFADTCKTVG